MGWDGSARLLAAVRYRQPADLSGVLDALRRGGIHLVEFTLDTPGALEAIEWAAADGKDVGAGTVLQPGQVKAAADAGAAFVVSPGTVPAVMEEAARLEIDAVPGALTPSEIIRARQMGAVAVKLFPASLGGPAYVRAVRGPIADTPLFVTGGIGVEDVREYLAAGAACVGLGGELVGRTPPASDRDLEAISDRAASAVAAAGR